jgi:hypothetical protein
MAAGTFDETLVAIAWFDETAEAIGWFDVDALGATAAPPSTIIEHVDLSVDEIDNDATTPTDIGSASAALTEDAPYLVVAMGHSATTNGSSHLNLLIGGTVVATETNHQGFGANDDQAPALSGTSQLACAYAFVPGPSETMQFQGWCDDVDFFATSCRAYALDLTNIVEDDGRWHEQTANSDTIVTTPSSGWTTVGNALVFTPTRSGDYAIIASAEAVHSGGSTADYCHIRLTQDGTEVSGTVHQQQTDSQLNQVHGYFVARRFTLSSGVSYSFAIQGNGTSSNGNYGFRRIRLHALEAAQIEDDDIQADVDSTGVTIVGTNSATPAMSVTLDPPAARDFLVLTDYQQQLTWWARGQFSYPGSDAQPPDGYTCSVTVADLGAGGDMPHTFGMFVIPAVATSTLVEILLATGPGASGAGGGAEFGNACVRTDDGDMAILSIRLATNAGETTGDFASSLPIPTMAASGTSEHTGAFASPLPVPTMAAAGQREEAGTFASSLPVPTMAASGLAEHAGAFATTLPVPVLAATGVVEHTGAFASPLPVPTMVAAGSVEHEGVFATTLPVVVLAAAGSVEHEGAFATTLPVPTMAAAGQRAEVSTFAAALPVPTMAAAGQRVELGTFASSLPVPVLAATGVVEHEGVFATTLPVPTMAAAGQRAEVGDFATTLPLPVLDASGVVEFEGIFAATLPLPVLDAAGDVTPQGVFASSLPLPVLDAAGTAEHEGTFATTLPVPLLDAQGIFEHEGTFATTLPVPTMASAGQRAEVGTFATTLPVPTMAAAGEGTLQGTFATTLPLPVLDASGSVEHEGTFATILPVVVFDATAAVEHQGDFASTLPLPVLDATGQHVAAGDFAITLPLPVLDALGGLGTFGIFDVSLPLPTMISVGIVTPSTPPPPPPPPPPPTPTRPRRGQGGPGGYWPMPPQTPPPPTPLQQLEAEIAQLEADDASIDEQTEEDLDDLAYDVVAELAAAISGDPMASIAATLARAMRKR